MVRTFCRSGENEAVKGAFHALGGILAAAMAAYNIAAWCYRRETHLGVNLERCEAVTPMEIEAA